LNAAAENEYVLSKTEFDAKDKNFCILNANKSGRYYIEIESSEKQGTAFTLTDKLSGVSRLYGETGEKDGEGYFLLEAGEYKISTYSLKKGKGVFRIKIIYSTEKNLEPETLSANESKRISLKENEQASYWIYVPRNQIIYFECAGRTIDDCRLWFEGEWLVESKTFKKVILTETGRQLNRLILAAEVNQGYYLLTIYGGKKNQWSNEGADLSEASAYPAYIKYGIKEIGNNIRFEDSLTEYGENLYLCSNEATFFLVQLAEKKDLVIEVSNFYYDKIFDFENFELSSSINKNSKNPETKIILGNSSSDHKIVRISGNPAEKFWFQIFQRYDYNEIALPNIRSTNDYWLSTLHSGFPQDNIDATGILVNFKYNGKPEILKKSLIEINADYGWSRRFNLTGENTIFLEFTASGNYQIKSEGVSAKYRLEPFLINKPNDYETPDWSQTNKKFYIEKGIYVLTLTPVKKGIINISIAKPDFIEKFFKNSTIQDNLVKSGVQFSDLYLQNDVSYKLYLNKQYRIDKGFTVRPYPIDLNVPLPVILNPNQQIELKSISFSQKSILTISGGEKIDCFLDGNKIENGTLLIDSYNNKILTLKNNGDKNCRIVIRTIPESIEKEKNKEIISNFNELKKNKFVGYEKLFVNQPVFFNLDYSEQKSFEFQIETSGTYRIESNGRLKLKAFVKTKISKQLYQEECNADNGNFVIQNFFKKGKYNITVESSDNTSGRAGIIIKPGSAIEIKNCEELKEYGLLIPPDNCLFAELNVDSSCLYYIESLGSNLFFDNRIEDSNGWPVSNIFKTPMITELEKGVYRLVSYPLTSETYRIFKFIKYDINKKKVEGKGFHKIRFGEILNNIWIDAEDIKNRMPDKYEFYLPAAAEISIVLTNYMKGIIKKSGESGISGIIDNIKGFTGKLEKGKYIAEIENSRFGNFMNYEIGLSSKELMAGSSIYSNPPEEHKISIGEPGVYRIFSLGQTDVRAELFDADDKQIAVSDDAGKNWNFSICKTLGEGKYKLKTNWVSKNENNQNAIANNLNSKPSNLDRVWEIKENANYTGSAIIKISAKKINLDAPELMPEGTEKEIELGDRIKQIGFIPKNEISSISLNSDKVIMFILEDSNGKEIFSKSDANINLKIMLISGKKYNIKLCPVENISTTAVFKLNGVKLQKQNELSNILGKPYTISGAEIFSSGEISTYEIEYLSNTGNELYCLDELEKPSIRITRLFVPLKEKTIFITGHERGEIEFKISKFRLNEGNNDVSFDCGRPLIIDVPVNNGEINCAVVSSVYNKLGSGILTNENSNNENQLIDINNLRINAGSSDFNINNNFTVLTRTGKLVIWNAENNFLEDPGINLKINLIKINFSKNIILTNNLNCSLPAKNYAVINPENSMNRIQFTIPPKSAVLSEKNSLISEAYYNFSEQYEIIKFSESNCRYYLINLQDSEIGTYIAAKSSDEKIDSKPFFETLTQYSRRKKICSGFDSGDLQFINMTGNYDILSCMDNTGKYVESDSVTAFFKNVRLSLRLKSGFFKYWFGAKANAENRFGGLDISNDKTIPLTENREIEIKSKTAAFVVKSDKNEFIKFSSGVPLVFNAVYEEDSKNLCSEIFGEKSGIVFPKGDNKIYFRGFAENTIDKISIEKENIEIIQDTYGTFSIMNPGDIKCFSFKIPSEKIIGVGIESGDETLDCSLINSNFKIINSGYHQINKLESGDYYILISLDKKYEKPVRFRPVLIGRFIPENFEPEEYIKKYFLLQ